MYLKLIFFFRYMDFINVMMYDLYGLWEKVIGYNSLLYFRREEMGFDI